MIDTAERMIQALVRIESVNPSLDSTGSGEGPLARFVADWLTDVGLEVALEECLPGRPNVVGRLQGRSGGPTLMWNAHLDTVGAKGMSIAPWDGDIRNGCVYGRGAADDKASLASMMLAAKNLADARDFSGELLLCGVVDEEYASAGTEAILRTYHADACVVGEDTGLDLVIAHQGFGWYEIETIGRAAHGMNPEEGIDAIAMMGHVLNDLSRFDHDILSRDVHPLSGRAVFHNSTIQGGKELGVYPDSCILGIEVGCNPGTRMSERRAEIERLLEMRATITQNFNARLTTILEREAFHVDEQTPIIKCMEDALRSHGRDPVKRGMNAWMDAALVQWAGIPTVVFGPGGGGLHASVEWADIEQVTTAVAVLTESARQFLRE